MTYLTLVPFLCKCRKIANAYINFIVKFCHSCSRGVLKDYSDWGGGIVSVSLRRESGSSTAVGRGTEEAA